jgi:hypothetical protein
MRHANRPQSRRQMSQLSQLWLNSSPQTLSSHITAMGKRNQDSARNFRSHNGNGQAESYYKNKQQGGFKKDRPHHHQRHGDGKSLHQRQRWHNSPPAAHKPCPDVQGGNGQSAVASQPPVAQTPASATREKWVANINPFDLFCAYHLGIEPNNTYRPANINQVANRFKVDPATIRQATKEYGFDSAAMLDRDFDLALAQLDIQVAPEGVSKIELAKGIYADFQKAPVQKRDWKKIIEEDQKENRKVFG